MLSDWAIFVRLIVAAGLSGVIGFEREFHGRAAGFRTHILLCVGSTLIMLTSMHIFDIYYPRISPDPARIAAGVITGIGFLGAGTILQYKSSVRGLTTAASLWVVSGIGLAVGSGFYYGAILTTLLTLVALMIFSKLERSMIRKDRYRTIVIESREGVDQLRAIREVLGECGAELTDFEVERTKDGSHMALKIGLKLYELKSADSVTEGLTCLDGVRSVRWESE